MNKFHSIKVGDTVIRMLAGVVPCQLMVTEVTDKTIVCGAWTFHRETGGEIDHDLGFDGVTLTGSILQPPEG